MTAENRLTVALNQVRSLLEAAAADTPPFPPTLLYNEGWLLRLVLDWFSQHQVERECLSFSPEARWFSEALLPSAFLARYRSDLLAEGWTRADGVIGHVDVGSRRKGDLVVNEDATQFVVLEAKLSSPLSSGVTKARYFDQAARIVACMAEALRRTRLRPGRMERLAFCVLAPEGQIRQGIFTTKMSPESILKKVTRRVRAYEGIKDRWFEEWFRPTWSRITVATVSWESVLADIEARDSKSGMAIGRFYELCLQYNKVA